LWKEIKFSLLICIRTAKQTIRGRMHAHPIYSSMYFRKSISQAQNPLAHINQSKLNKYPLVAKRQADIYLLLDEKLFPIGLTTEKILRSASRNYLSFYS